MKIQVKQPSTTETLAAAKSFYAHMESSTLKLSSPAIQSVLKLLSRFGIKSAEDLASFFNSPLGIKYVNQIVRDILELDALLKEKIIDMQRYELLLHRIALCMVFQKMASEEARTAQNHQIQSQMDALYKQKTAKTAKNSAKNDLPSAKELMATYTALEKAIDESLELKIQEEHRLREEITSLEAEKLIAYHHYEQLSALFTPELFQETTVENVEEQMNKVKQKFKNIFPQEYQATREGQPEIFTVDQATKTFARHVRESSNLRGFDIWGKEVPINEASFLVPKSYDFVVLGEQRLLFQSEQRPANLAAAPVEVIRQANESFDTQVFDLMSVLSLVDYHHKRTESFFNSHIESLYTRQISVQGDIATLYERKQQISSIKQSLAPQPFQSSTAKITEALTKHFGAQKRSEATQAEGATPFTTKLVASPFNTKPKPKTKEEEENERSYSSNKGQI